MAGSGFCFVTTGICRPLVLCVFAVVSGLGSILLSKLNTSPREIMSEPDKAEFEFVQRFFLLDFLTAFYIHHGSIDPRFVEIQKCGTGLVGDEAVGWKGCRFGRSVGVNVGQRPAILMYQRCSGWGINSPLFQYKIHPSVPLTQQNRSACKGSKEIKGLIWRNCNNCE